MIIAVTGTPATGKSALAKALADLLSFKYIDLNRLIEEKGWHEGRDEERDTLIVDEERLTERVKDLLTPGKDYVIDSHLAQFITPEVIDACVVCTCELKELKRRLEERGYSQKKVRENLDAEIFELCRVEAEEKGHNIIIVDTTIETTEVLARGIREKVGGKT